MYCTDVYFFINRGYTTFNQVTGKQLEAAVTLYKKEKGLTLEDVAGQFDITRGYLHMLFKKGDEQIDDHYDKVAKKLGMKIPDVTVTSRPVPLYDVDATAGNVTIFNEDRTEYIKSYISVPAFADCDMFITISGNSMYPKFCSGEMVALKKIEDMDVIAMGEAYIVVTKEQRLLKYIRKTKDEKKLLLVSEHPDFDAFEIDRKKILHLYIVKGKITKTII